ncbi:hypothetical protein [Streptomyces sp. TLI_171]|uniref:hypothetical protein n=1 Tax=Streptomyces sp. TLI_171 TaxID=1938859 RepID=UPI000C5E3BC5|nr:hypothetical protein [Streptomyces sp. TLI_171]RKE18602.1 hypothetical protein BX266_1895 [Streptomyces sp. TLI_171]
MTGRQKTLLASTVAAALALTTAVLLWPAPHRPAAAPPPPPSASPTPSPSPSKTYPYPHFLPGECFLVPRLSKVHEATGVPCDQPHDAEAIAVADLPDGLTDLPAIFHTMNELCKAPTAETLAKAAGGPRFSSSIGLPLEYYQQGWRGITCALTFKN